MTTVKTIIDEKGVYSAVGGSSTDTGLQKTYGGMVETPDLVGGNVTLTLTSSVVAVVGSGNVLCTLPANPTNGQKYEIMKATSAAMTVSLTGSNTAHTINGSTATATLLTTAGKALVQFVGSPANMWITK